MDKSLYDQINNLLEKSNKILLLTHAKADCDGLGAALSAYAVLKGMGKEVTVATNDPVAEYMNFLPSIEILQNSLSASSDFVITLDTSEASISKIKYNTEGNKFNIIVTPKEGIFIPDHVSFTHGTANYDLIIVFDTGNLEHLGPLYDKNVEMFYKTPIINIDHHASNTDFGQVNLVNVTAASTTEVFFDFLRDLEKKQNKKLITEDIATLLLAGLITDTGSFQHANTSPQSMEAAAKMLDLGARQQEIIKNIYKTKKLSTLKLWGIILSKVQVDPVHRMVWSVIDKKDLKEANANSEETEGIIDDLLNNAPGVEVVFLIKWNEQGYVSISMRSTTNAADVGAFCADNGGGGHVRAAGFKVKDGRPFDQIMTEVVNKVRAFQAGRLNIQPEDLEAVQQISDGPELPFDETEEEPDKLESSTGETTYLDFKAPNSDSEPNSRPIVDDAKSQTTHKRPTNDPQMKEGPIAAPKEEKQENDPNKPRRRRRRRRRPTNPDSPDTSAPPK